MATALTESEKESDTPIIEGFHVWWALHRAHEWIDRLGGVGMKNVKMPEGGTQRKKERAREPGLIGSDFLYSVPKDERLQGYVGYPGYVS